MNDENLLKKVDGEFRKLLDSAGERGPDAAAQMAEMNEKMLKKNFTMQGKPFPTFLRPLFVHRSTMDYLVKTTNNVMSALEKVVELYFENPEYEKYFEMDPLDKELAKIDPRYPRREIQARLDAFVYDDGSVKFLEFNCDSPSGMGWHDQLIGLFRELPVIRELQGKFTAEFRALLPPFFQMLKAKNRQFGNPEDIPFAIVCKRDSTIRYDVDLIVEHINEKEGHQAIFADPRDFEYDGERLTLNGTPIGLIYRDAIQDFTDYMDDVQPVMNALKDGKVCFINPFASRVGGLKCVLWFMTDEKTQHLFTREEVKTIRESIPWTRFMKDEKTLYKGETIDLREYVRSHKDMFVLKPNGGYGGYNVTIGTEVDQNHWDKVVEATQNESWVVQELLDIPSETFPSLEPDLTWKPKNVNINFFAFDGQFGGGFVRISEGAIINIHQGGGLIPICYIK